MLITIALISRINLFSQGDDEIRIKAGHSISEYFSLSQRFRYEQFQEGTIYYEKGKVSLVHKFNYDLINNRMLVIQAGDTVPVVPIDQKIKYYKIGNERFFNISDNQIVEIFSDGDSIVLGMTSKYIVKRTETVSSNGYGSGYDPTGAISSRGARDGTFMQDVILKKLIIYYVMTNGKIFHASRSKILKNFPNQKDSIKMYLESKKVDFNSRRDLEKLVNFLKSVVSKT